VSCSPLAYPRAVAIAAVMACQLGGWAVVVSSPSGRPSLHGLDCIVVGAGTGPVSRTVTVCPPLVSTGSAR
jgi:hypothetical protein